MKHILTLIAILISVSAFSQKNSIEALSRYEHWNKGMSDRTFFYGQYGRHEEKFDAFVRSTIMLRDGESGLIFDADYYPKFKKGYGYFNLGYSNAELFFPRLRGAAEVYKPITKKIEASLGTRYINVNFPEQYNIWSLTGTLGYYFGDYFAYVRPTVSFIDDGIGWNGMGVIRRYFDKNYVELMAAKGVDTGISRNVNAIENNFGLQSYIVRVKGYYNLNELTILSLGYDFSGIFIPAKDEYTQINSIDITIRRKF
jgi:YaiO family outer membrane protein